ncbi:DUF4386 domain-containing protein [Kutzneria sp. 744]|uniref:DUF4386 domain-containing protein n=1 Tax=Kutzneria sp. (strain 744) TaxID=345341 RepID=UPI0003EED36C|nr:DUF4386 domain-containing protein [Kutzneria sp. 744]EWM17622.1 hypothetical protein KUTG_07926 [Kutzneria sp. 744]
MRSAGALYLVTHVTSIAAVILYDRLLTDPSSGTNPNVQVGALLEIILALAVIGTAVALYPFVKRHGEAVALGYIGLRTLEAAVIAVGVLPLLALPSVEATTLFTLQQRDVLLGPRLRLRQRNTVLAASSCSRPVWRRRSCRS